jgi:hypothetical protein
MTAILPPAQDPFALAADLLDPPKATSRWYCDREDCDGEPHDGWHWCSHPIGSDKHGWECRHARTNQRPPPEFVSGEARGWLLMAGRGYGKLLELSTPIPTPSGWTTMRELRVGDQVFDEAGRPCNVTGVFDEFPERAWRVRFSDGTSLVAGGEHQWVTWTHAERKAFLRSDHEPTAAALPADWPNWRARRLPTRFLAEDVVARALDLHREGLSARRIEAELGCSRAALAPHLRAGRYASRVPRSGAAATGPRIRTTDEIVATLTYGKRGDRNHSIPVAGALELPPLDLPVDPYVLGVWLGDGSTAEAVVTLGDRDAEEILARLAERGTTVTGRARRKPDGHTATYPIGGVPLTRDAKGRVRAPGSLGTRLRALGVIGNKHVPDEYLRASREQRLGLLRGLMDSDGHAQANATQVEFTSTNRRLAEAVAELARSLGQKPVIGEYRATLRGRDVGPKWRVHWRPTIQVFALTRKAERLAFGGAQAFRSLHRMITAVEPLPVMPMRCITVDSPNSMYLAGEGMVPTHNSRAGAEWLADQAKSTPYSYWAVVGPTLDVVRDICIEGESGLLQALGWQRHDERYNKTRLRLHLDNGTIIRSYSAESPRKARGPNLYGAWLEEIAQWQYREMWDNLFPALRRGLAQYVITTTPAPMPLVREFATRTDGSVVITRGSTFDNARNLAPHQVEELKRRWAGTRRERQELYGELLEDVAGALWQARTIEDTRGVLLDD